MKKSLTETYIELVSSQNVQKLEEHNDVVAVSQEKLAPSVQEFVKLFQEKKPEETKQIKDVYLIEIEGGWDISDCLIVLESGSTYKVTIPSDNDGSIAAEMGYKRTPTVKYVAPTFEMACNREQIDYVS